MKRQCNKAGVVLRYSSAKYMRMSYDEEQKLIAPVRRAVPRLRRAQFDTGNDLISGKREIEIDFGRGWCGLSKSEVSKIKRAMRGRGVRVVQKRVACC